MHLAELLCLAVTFFVTPFQAELESELDNRKVRVLRGNRVETASGELRLVKRKMVWVIRRRTTSCQGLKI
jgi:hypothetical protein